MGIYYSLIRFILLLVFLFSIAFNVDAVVYNITSYLSDSSYDTYDLYVKDSSGYHLIPKGNSYVSDVVPFSVYILRGSTLLMLNRYSWFFTDSGWLHPSCFDSSGNVHLYAGIGSCSNSLRCDYVAFGIDGTFFYCLFGESGSLESGFGNLYSGGGVTKTGKRSRGLGGYENRY